MLCGFFICCCFINKNVAYGEQISLATNSVTNTLIDLLPTLLPTSTSYIYYFKKLNADLASLYIYI